MLSATLPTRKLCALPTFKQKHTTRNQRRLVENAYGVCSNSSSSSSSSACAPRQITTTARTQHNTVAKYHKKAKDLMQCPHTLTNTHTHTTLVIRCLISEPCALPQSPRFPHPRAGPTCGGRQKLECNCSRYELGSLLVQCLSRY